MNKRKPRRILPREKIKNKTEREEEEIINKEKMRCTSLIWATAYIR